MWPVPLSLYPISKSCVWETPCGTTDKRRSPCPATLLHLSRLSSTLVLLAVSFFPFTKSFGSFTFFSFAESPHLPIHLLPLLLFFITICTFFPPLRRPPPPLIILPVSFPHVYLAVSLSLVVSSLGKLKRCEEGNKSKSKKRL